MPPLLGLDYAGGRPGGAAISTAGYAFVCRYLSDGGPSLPGKLLTPAEYADLQAHNIAVAVNWETLADRMKSGYDAGVADANAALSHLRAIGYPNSRPVYFSADFDASPADQAEINDYLRGAISVLGLERVGIYGSYYVCQRALNAQTASWAWQAAAWSGGLREPRAHLYQRIGTTVINGVECDVNEALQADFGQHPYDAARRKERHDMDELPATPPPADPNSDPASWPQRNYDIGFDVAGGWEGDFAFQFGVQEWPGRTTDDVRGYLRLASWETPTGLVPVTEALSTGGTGMPVRDHTAVPAVKAPPGATGLTLNYSAPGGAWVSEGRSG